MFDVTSCVSGSTTDSTTSGSTSPSPGGKGKAVISGFFGRFFSLSSSFSFCIFLYSFFEFSPRENFEITLSKLFFLPSSSSL